LTKQAQKDQVKLKAVGLSEKTKELVDIISINPYQNPPPYEKLVGNMAGLYSRRINIQHRLVYEVNETLQVVKILRMWTHYD
jgi:Txe/YoeB family toxin of toxin-antitoxin system